MFKRVGFIFNADDCIACRACEMACKNENQTPPHVRWRKVKELDSELTLSISCNHCDSPECFRVCPEQAFSKRFDGIVQIDEDLCNGCQLCVEACPYEAPQFDPETQKVSKCQMCYQRLDIGLPPACVESCSTRALNMVNLNSFHDPTVVRSITGFPDIELTKPSIVFYQKKERKQYFLE